MLRINLKKEIYDDLFSLSLIAIISIPLYVTIVDSIFDHNQRYLEFVNNTEKNLKVLENTNRISQRQADKYFKLLSPLRNNQEISRINKLLIVPYVKKSFKIIYLNNSFQCNVTGLQIDGQDCQKNSFNEEELKRHIEKLWSDEIIVNLQEN